MADITIPIQDNLTTAPLELGSFVSNIVGLILIIAAVATFAFLVWGGIEWITAGGDKAKIESARNRITGAIVGLAIVALSWAIFLIIDNFLGLGIAGATSSNYNSGSGDNNNASGNVVNSRCICGMNTSNLCASTGDISPGTDVTYICDASRGWIPTTQTWSGQAIDCLPCN